VNVIPPVIAIVTEWRFKWSQDADRAGFSRDPHGISRSYPVDHAHGCVDVHVHVNDHGHGHGNDHADHHGHGA